MSIRFEVTTPDLFLSLRKVTIEENRGTGRIYFLKGDRIIGVAVPT